MILILILWSVLASIFFGIPFSYYFYMKKQAAKPWHLIIDETYEPHVSILIPVYNEEQVIRFKLENLLKLDYPAEKIEILVLNDASTDKTLEEVYNTIDSHHGRHIKLLNIKERLGKSKALNLGLEQVKSDIIIVSDADCFLASDTLRRALPYLYNNEVGAVAGREILLNPHSSWVTKSEVFFNNFVQPQRLGESKVHSTIFFQGGFAAYKKPIFEEFDLDNDDSGTALNVVQKSSRAIIIPEARFYTMFPVSWKNKIALKLRRANHLTRVWIRCLKLLLQGKLILSDRIAIPEVFLQIFNPLLFLALIFLTSLVFLEHTFLALAFLLILLVVLLVPRGRIALIESVQLYFILLAAMISFVTRRPFRMWKTEDESRLLLNEKILREMRLI